jgi:FtsP/CotA-like multicopper oxidase with cupredoxin domain
MLATPAFAQDCGSATNLNLVENPPGYHTGTLVMDKIDLTLNNGETLTTRAYAQEGQAPSIPGPTLVMKPGQQYVMSFKNLLPYEPLTHEHNTFTDPNVTNVHTHGLHISGESPGDDVTRAFEGQRGGDYVYDIPANHMGGSFWYHAHHHGSTFLQVSTGAFGLIIIDDAEDGIPANVAAMEEKHLLLGYLEPGNAAGTGGDSLISGSFSAGWTINGKVNGDVCVPPNTWQHWRMLVADQDSRLVDLEIGANCEVALMGRDGVWRTEVPKALPDGTLTLTGASRADLAVRCSDNSSISVAGTQVANILVDQGASSDSGPHPFAADKADNYDQPWLSARPAYLRDLRDGNPNATVQDSETIRMGARTILGRKFDATIPNLEKTANGVQEWSINGAAQHPFHLHIYHVQVQSDCGPYESGEYYDVIAGNCDVRFDMSPEEAYEGMTILHCHILQHEDQGAMGWMDVTNGRPPPEFPSELLFSDYYTLGEDPPTGTPDAPTNLSATAISSSQINLAWDHDSSGVDYFSIERDSAFLVTVPAGITSYQDTGLPASTTFEYRVAAVNDSGSSGYSNTDGATTQTTGGNPTSVQVQSISVSTANEGKGVKSGLATVTIVDNLGSPVDGALVSGNFEGDITEEVIEAQTVDGSVTIPTSGKSKPLNTLSFCVTSVTHDTLANFTGPVCGSL